MIVRYALSMNMLRTISGLIIVLIMLPLCVMAFNYIADIRFEYSEINDEIALSQLRENLLIIYDLHFGRDTLNFRYKNNDFRLSLVNRKLILQPGTQIYLDDIDDLYFEKRGELIYVIYERNDKQYERILCTEKGIHLDEFSDCDVSDYEYRDSED